MVYFFKWGIGFGKRPTPTKKWSELTIKEKRLRNKAIKNLSEQVIAYEFKKRSDEVIKHPTPEKQLYLAALNGYIRDQIGISGTDLLKKYYQTKR